MKALGNLFENGGFSRLETLELVSDDKNDDIGLVYLVEGFKTASHPLYLKNLYLGYSAMNDAALIYAQAKGSPLVSCGGLSPLS